MTSVTCREDGYAEDPEFIVRVLDKLYKLVSEAYYTTPPHIVSRSLIKRSLELIHHLRVSIKAGQAFKK